MDVNRAKAAVVLMSFVGAPSSPFGNSITRQGNNAPDQLETQNHHSAQRVTATGAVHQSPVDHQLFSLSFALLSASDRIPTKPVILSLYRFSHFSQDMSKI